MEKNINYSHGDFLGQTFLDVDPSEFSNSTIVGSCFYQESSWDVGSLGDSAKSPLVAVFPVGVVNVEFKRCNLDNVIIPTGSTVDSECTNRKVRIQNDNEDWELAAIDNKPVEPLSKKRLIRDGDSVDPRDIPTTRDLQ